MRNRSFIWSQELSRVEKREITERCTVYGVWCTVYGVLYGGIRTNEHEHRRGSSSWLWAVGSAARAVLCVMRESESRQQGAGQAGSGILSPQLRAPFHHKHSNCIAVHAAPQKHHDETWMKSTVACRRQLGRSAITCQVSLVHYYSWVTEEHSTQQLSTAI